MSTSTLPAVRTYGARSTRRPRRTKAAMAMTQDAILDIAAEQQPMTVRQLFYQLVSRGVIDKTEREYKSTVGRLVTNMRRDGALPYTWIADNTRWMRKPRTYGSLDDMLQTCRQTYRRALWDDQADYVEVWLEKEALAGVLIDVTREWDVPLMVCRGYPSVSFLYSAAETIRAQDRPIYIYYFGDHDPSGVDIDRFVERELRTHAPDADLCFERVAVLPDQIDERKLQTRPTKRTDTRSRKFRGESVEVDAIAPDELRRICHECIVQHIDREQLDRTLAVEKAERDTLTLIVEGAA